ncbi:cytochrome ubiquinol oxidase subunit I [Bacteroides caecigallinarum]|uniref:cytochrome ubiquinol oxidase subunit I n=1 Tax=Bacteroides caecigallinarum TaxID=1411144 RepID=UPI00195A0E32|nr:cytochrome ubiquinol oxidase subunit I [Bacteroides caecigallinarum]MBM6882058.1 cytochrome ubiquinol oxidase subunit I [Bacteroides caecigallinarum]
MIEAIDTSLIDWSRAQFALTAMYHWLFVPLTLGLAVIMGTMETVYYRTGNEFWKRTAKFWMKLFGINFAVGVATGLILEFQFGTNWSNYSWFVGDIFGAPLAIEGILAFFMEATFIAVMFFGWEKVSRRFHLASTWLTGLGATISAWWILVANSWMQYPVGMEFNPDTMRNEMVDFMSVAFSPVAVVKFFHTVISSWILGAVFVVGVSCWYLIKKREKEFAKASIKVASAVGLFASIVTAATGDQSAYQVAQVQPMKLASMEALYDGSSHAPLTVVGPVEIPEMLSVLATHSADGFVPGINDIMKGGYKLSDGTKALSVGEKIERGKMAIKALADYREAKKEGNSEEMETSLNILNENMPYFGYGYIKDTSTLVPNVNLMFWSFRVMVGLGMYFIVLFAVMMFLTWKKTCNVDYHNWLLWLGLWSIPLAYIASQAGWIVAEVGRQPWTIQDMLPVDAAISRLETGSVQTTFFIFLIMFTVLLIAEIGIMLKAIKHGPEER